MIETLTLQQPKGEAGTLPQDRQSVEAEEAYPADFLEPLDTQPGDREQSPFIHRGALALGIQTVASIYCYKDRTKVCGDPSKCGTHGCPDDKPASLRV